MSVSVVKITEPIGVNKKTNKNVNIYATSAAGGAAGLALRQFLPVYKNEMDSVLFCETETIRQNNIKLAKKNVLNEIREAVSKNKENTALNLFFDRISAINLQDKAIATNDVMLKEEAKNLALSTKEKIKNAPEAVQNQIKEFTKTVINKVKAARVLSESTILASVKQQRPVHAFLLPGIALGALAGFVYNVVGAISED